MSFRSAFTSVLVLFLLAPAVFAQSGHWEGVIQIPGNELSIEVDLAKNEKGAWTGAIAVPAQKLKGFPLTVAVEGNTINFAMKGIPGEPAFQGKLSADGKTMSGNFIQSGGSFTFQLTRSGEAQLEAPPKSTPIAKEFEGSWEGTLDMNGKVLRLVLKLANQAEGAAGTLVSVDQGGAELPITTITQKGSNLKFEVKTIFGSYNGELNKEGTQLVGQWTQGPNTLPLTLKRAAKPEK